MEDIQQNNFYYNIKFKTLYLLALMCPIILYIMFKHYLILYIGLVSSVLSAFIFCMVNYFRHKIGRQLDIEIALALIVVDMITRFFLPTIFYTIDNIIIFSLMTLFVYRQTKIPIKKNLLFLFVYSIFYFCINYKYLNFNKITSIPDIIYSLVLAGTFSYTLLATAKSKHFYRSTFCAGISLICIIILGKRIIGNLDNAFVVAQSSATVLVVFAILYWYDGKETYADLSLERKKIIYNVQILPNLIGGLAFIGYLFEIKVDSVRAVWSLVIVVSIWYFFSMIKALYTMRYSTESTVCENFKKSQIERLGKYARHIRDGAELIE